MIRVKDTMRNISKVLAGYLLGELSLAAVRDVKQAIDAMLKEMPEDPPDVRPEFLQDNVIPLHAESEVGTEETEPPACA